MHCFLLDGITSKSQFFKRQVLYGDRHASLKLLKGYFVMHRLFLHCCDQWPEIRVVADMALKEFVSSEEGRTKQATPWLAYILQLLTISNMGWEEVKEAFLEEALAREVQFILPRYPSYSPTVEEDELSQQSSKSTSDLWRITDHLAGSDHLGAVGTVGPGNRAREVSSETYRGAARGWSCIEGLAPAAGAGTKAHCLVL